MKNSTWLRIWNLDWYFGNHSNKHSILTTSLTNPTWRSWTAIQCVQCVLYVLSRPPRRLMRKIRWWNDAPVKFLSTISVFRCISCIPLIHESWKSHCFRSNRNICLSMFKGTVDDLISKLASRVSSTDDFILYSYEISATCKLLFTSIHDSFWSNKFLYDQPTLPALSPVKGVLPWWRTYASSMFI